MSDDTLILSPAGLYCPAGDFHIDPWLPVERAVITHAHSDHARPGSQRYLTSQAGVGVLRLRVGDEPAIRGIAYGDTLTVGDVAVSLHPAGHLLGSAQVRIEHRGHVTVVSGDYKGEPDRTCAPFEPVRCHRFITESTFGLPIYRWQPQATVFAGINEWWRANQQAGRTSILYAYALGKAQRLLAGVDASIGPILVHGAVQRFLAPYAAEGIALPPTLYAESGSAKATRGRALVVAPLSGAGMAGWLRKFGETSAAFASGWMMVRGARRRRAVDRGFVLSDHADWDGLLAAIAATGAERVDVTHGYTTVLSRWLREQGLASYVLPTHWEGERAEVGDVDEGDDNTDGPAEPAEPAEAAEAASETNLP